MAGVIPRNLGPKEMTLLWPCSIGDNASPPPPVVPRDLQGCTSDAHKNCGGKNQCGVRHLQGINPP